MTALITKVLSVATLGCAAAMTLTLNGRAADDERARGSAMIKEDIAIKASAPGPSLPLPKPGPDRAVVDEVVDSLKIMQQDHAARAGSVRVPGSEKLSRPFPEPPYLTFSPRSVTAPYDLWTFEVLEGVDSLMRRDGTGRVVEPIEWDGSGPSGDDAVRVGRTYLFRFTGRRGAEAFVVTSEPVTLLSLSLREYLGGTRLEVANSEVFEAGKAKLTKEAAKYLRPMADRLRRLPGKRVYKLEVADAKPDSKLAEARAAALRRWFADALLVNAAEVQVDRRSSVVRGDVTACLLPADRGETISDR